MLKSATRAMVLGFAVVVVLALTAAPASAGRWTNQGATVISSTQVKLTFSAVVDSSADDPGRYSISPYLEILSAERVDNNRAVLLTTTPQTNGVPYRVAIAGGGGKKSGSIVRFIGTTQGANDPYTFHDDFNRATGIVATDSPIPGPWSLTNLDFGNELGLSSLKVLGGSGALRSRVIQTGAENDDANVRTGIGSTSEFWASAYVYIPSGQFWGPTHEVGLLRINQFADTAHARLTAFGATLTDFDLQVNWKESAGIGYHGETLVASDLPYDQWHWLQLHVKNGPAGSGEVQVFVNGLVAYSQDTIAVQREPMKFFEAGIMHTVSGGAPSLTYTDELRAGGDYQLPSVVLDTTAPTGVAVTAPADGALVEGTVTVDAVASDDFGVQRVDFLVDDVPLFTDDTAPFSTQFDTTGLPTGDYDLTVMAYDTSGNTTTSDPVTVTVDTSPPARGATVVSSTQVKLVFDEPLDPTATDVGRYDITPSLTVTTAELVDSDHAVLLTTAPQTNAMPYTVSMTSMTGKRTPTTAEFLGTTQGTNGLTTIHDDFNRAAGIVTTDTPIPGPWSFLNLDAGNEAGLSTEQVLHGSRALRSRVTRLGGEVDDAHVRYPIQGSEFWASAYVYIPGGQSWEVGHEAGLLRLNQFADTAHARLTAVYTAGDVVDLSVNWKESAEIGYHGETVAATGVALDQWHWLQLHVKNGPAGSGEVQVFVDGAVTYSQDTIAVQEEPMRFVEAGIMHTVSSGPATLTHTDELRGGTAYQLPAIAVDITPPHDVAVTAPADGATVDGTVTLTADADDDRGVQRVEFFVAGDPVATDDCAPFTADVDLGALPLGGYEITARAYDTSGNATTSDPVTVTVDNTPPVAGATVISSTQVKLVFDAPLDAAGADLDRYSITPALDVTAAELVDGDRAVLLTTAAQTHGVSYTVTAESASGTKPATSADFLGTTQGPNGATAMHDDFNRTTGLVTTDTPIPGPWSLATVDPGNTLALSGEQVLHGAGALRAQVTKITAGNDDANLRTPIGPASELWASAYLRIPSGQGWEVGHQVGLLRLNQYLDTAHARLTITSVDDTTYDLYVNWKESTETGYHGETLVAAGLGSDQWHLFQLHVRNGAAGTGAVQVFVDGEVAFSQDTFAVQQVPMTYVEGGITNHVSTGPASLAYTDELRAGTTYQLPAIVTDTTAPSAVAVTAPAAGAVVDGGATLAADATDDLGVQRLEFFVDGAPVGSDDVAPFSVQLDATGLSDGDHDITATAYDTSGNATTSDAVTVTVDNSPPARGATVMNSTQVKLVFDEPLDPAADDPDRYSISPSLAVTGAEIVDGGHAALLTTAPQTNAVAYTVSMTSVTGLKAPTAAEFLGTTQGANVAPTLHDDFNRATGLFTTDTPIPGPWAVATVDAGNELGLSDVEVLQGSGSLRALVTKTAAEADDAYLRSPLMSANEYWAAAYVLIPSGQEWEDGHEVGLLRLDQFADTAHARLIAVEADETTFDLHVDWKESAAIGYHGDTVASTGVAFDEWHWLQFHVKNGLAGSGVIQVFLDGVLVYQQDTIAVQQEPMKYVEAGIMHMVTSGPDSLTYTDELRAGTAYQLPSVIDDTAAPTGVVVTAPTGGSTIDGSATLAADATDDRGVQRMEFFVDGAPVGSDDVAPFSIVYDATSLTTGDHDITATAYDTSGNATTSDPVTVAVDNLPPVISGQSVAPSPFSPNGDGVTETTTVRFTTEEPTTYRIQIVNDSTGLVQQTLRNWTAAGAGEISATWNGLYWDAGAGASLPAPDGWYTVRVEVLDHVNRPASVEMPLCLNRVLSSVSRTRSSIAPASLYSTYRTTSVSYTLLGTATASVVVEDGGGTVVRTVQAPVEQTAGTYSGVIWDGKDDGGTVVPSGTYQVRVVATDAVGTVSIARSVLVDATAPVITIDSITPQPWYPATDILTVAFTVSEPGTATVRFYKGTSGTATKTITQPVAAAGPTSVTWDGVDKDGLPAGGGTYKVKIWYEDSLGIAATVYPVEATFLLLVT